MRNRQGFSLFELVTVIAIISILAVVGLSRLLPYIDEAERVSVIRLEGQLRSTLVMEAAKRIARGESATITDLDGSNPVQFLLEPPNNYVGELNASAPEGVGPRKWYFDSRRRELVYRLGQAFAPIVSDEYRENPAFSVRVAYSDRDGDGQFEASRDELHGVHLVRVAGAGWLAGVAAN